VRTSRLALALWIVLIVVLLVVELAEITRVFTVPIENTIGDPLAFVTAFIFTTLVALVGAIFIGVLLSARLMSPTGFTPFEEEMLRMRADLQQVKRDVAEIRGHGPADAPNRTSPDTEEEDP